MSKQAFYVDGDIVLLEALEKKLIESGFKNTNGSDYTKEYLFIHSENNKYHWWYGKKTKIDSYKLPHAWDAVIGELKEPVHEIKIGDWIQTLKDHYFGQVFEVSPFYIRWNDPYANNTNGTSINLVTKITPEQALELMKAEAVRRGYVEGVYVKDILRGDNKVLNGSYHPETDTYILNYKNPLFGIYNKDTSERIIIWSLEKGWAEIIKEEPITVAGYTMKKYEGSAMYKIGCYDFDICDVHCIQSLLKSTGTLSFKGGEITEELLEKIEAKMKSK